jgi:hypothetical protein
MPANSNIAKPSSDAQAHAAIAASVASIQSFFEMVTAPWLPGRVPSVLFEDAGNRAQYTGAFSGACRPHVLSICGVIASHLDVQLAWHQHGEFNEVHRDFSLRYVVALAPLVSKYRYEPEDESDLERKAEWVVGLEAAVGSGIQAARCPTVHSYLVEPKVTLLLQVNPDANFRVGYGC